MCTVTAKILRVHKEDAHYEKRAQLEGFVGVVDTSTIFPAEGVQEYHVGQVLKEVSAWVELPPDRELFFYKVDLEIVKGAE